MNNEIVNKLLEGELPKSPAFLIDNSYVLMFQDRGKCAKCGEYIWLLIDENFADDLPKFSICFKCKEVFELHQGKIESDEPPTQA